MKRFITAGLMALALAGGALAQPSSIYQNDTIVVVPPQVPPQVDATSFVNNGSFNINFTNFANGTVQLYETADTLNYTNSGSITGNSGFRFDYFSSSRQNAANFVNGNRGSVIVGSATNSFFTNNFFNLFGGSKLLVSATNIINSGLLEVGTDGLLGLSGKNINLTRGSLRVEGANDNSGGFFFFNLFNGVFQSGSFFNSGIFDEFWGTGIGSPGGTFTLPNPRSPFENAQNVQNGFLFQSVVASNATAYSFIEPVGPSNVNYTVVFLANTNKAIATDVRFAPNFFARATPVVQWFSVVTNSLGLLVTNQLYLSDTLGLGLSGLSANGSFGISPALTPTFRPGNYSFLRTLTNFSSFATNNTGLNSPLLSNLTTNREYSIYGASLQPTTRLIFTNYPGSTVSNLPGRIEITADQVLDLTRVRIDGENYLKIKSTNHFIGSTNAQIISPYSDIFLGSTNGSMVISNLLAPAVPRLSGEIQVWSGHWTNIVGGITNDLHVMIVSSALAPTGPCLIQDMTLRSTNLYISDILNSWRSLLIDAERVTISSNLPGAPTASGQLNLTASNIIWSASLPRLKYLTNFGTISTLSSTYFAGARQPPFFSSTFTEPYQAFVNHGLVSAAGSSIWATYFENTGSGVITNLDLTTTTNLSTIFSFSGPITIQAERSLFANNVLRANGAFAVPFGDITLLSGDTVISNNTISAFGKLTLQVTNSITDGGATASNIWQVNDGFDLLVKPTIGDLLGTTVTNICPDFTEVVNTWAGEDRGVSPSGFANNTALGHVILDGGMDCLFTFTGAGGQNAIYIDLLELKNYATNRSNPDFTSLNVTPNMTVYFADAKIGNVDISEKLDGANGGRLRWVSSFAGPFSSTNLVSLAGNTYAFNRALALSSSIDSDHDGIVNSADTTPFFTPDSVLMSVKMIKQPKLAAQISWQTVANSTNSLYYCTNMHSGNWVMLTNFIQGAANGLVTVTDTAKTNAPCFYRVRVDAKLP